MVRGAGVEGAGTRGAGGNLSGGSGGCEFSDALILALLLKHREGSLPDGVRAVVYVLYGGWGGGAGSVEGRG